MGKLDVRTKVQKAYPEFPEAVDGMSVDSLKQELLRYAKETENVVQHLENLNEPGEVLYLAKAAVSEITGPINDAKKAIKLKMSYLVSLIEEKGGSVP